MSELYQAVVDGGNDITVKLPDPSGRTGNLLTLPSARGIDHSAHSKPPSLQAANILWWT
jgi:hypothetical protein